MFYTLKSEHCDSEYIFIDWQRLDACLKATDRDKAGRLCGKRAVTSGLTAGSDEARKAASKVRAAKGMKGREQANLERYRKNYKYSPQQLSRFRKTKEEDYLMNNPLAEKALRRKAKKSGKASHQLMNLEAKKATARSEQVFRESERRSIEKANKPRKRGPSVISTESLPSNFFDEPKPTRKRRQK